ncbi:hypothetical protein GCM10007383_11440 [Arenibacter certesii]|uniref:Uncharacterized protein n=1 Tax=Arenibacter certesii TaxID=228955 RepID=A0A918IST1_9FLAO|nr:hypothetical protein GCM10007383_11440 [Arenibacter certesii]
MAAIILAGETLGSIADITVAITIPGDGAIMASMDTQDMLITIGDGEVTVIPTDGDTHTDLTTITIITTITDQVITAITITEIMPTMLAEEEYIDLTRLEQTI